MGFGDRVERARDEIVSDKQRAEAAAAAHAVLQDLATQALRRAGIEAASYLMSKHAPRQPVGRIDQDRRKRPKFVKEGDEWCLDHEMLLYLSREGTLRLRQNQSFLVLDRKSESHTRRVPVVGPGPELTGALFTPLGSSASFKLSPASSDRDVRLTVYADARLVLEERSQEKLFEDYLAERAAVLTLR